MMMMVMTMMMMMRTDDDNRTTANRLYRVILYNCARVPSGDYRGQSVYPRVPAAMRVRATAGSNSERDCPILNFHSVQSVVRPGDLLFASPRPYLYIYM